MSSGGLKSLSGVGTILCTKVKSVGSVLQIELWSPRVTVSACCHHKARTGPEQQATMWSPLENTVMAGISQDTEGAVPLRR